MSGRAQLAAINEGIGLSYLEMYRYKMIQGKCKTKKMNDAVDELIEKFQALLDGLLEIVPPAHAGQTPFQIMAVFLTSKGYVPDDTNYTSVDEWIKGQNDQFDSYLEEINEDFTDSRMGIEISM